MTKEEIIVAQVQKFGLHYLNDEKTDDLEFITTKPYEFKEKSIMAEVMEGCSEDEFTGILELGASMMSGWRPEITELMERTGCDNPQEARDEMDAIMYSLKHAYEHGMTIEVGDITIAENAKRFEESLLTAIEEQTSNVAFMDEIDMLIAFNETSMLKYLKSEYINARVEVPEKLMPY